jgi:GT2 family glycosyltransferase
LKLAHGALSANSRRIVGAQYTIPRDSSWVAKAWYGDLCQLKQGPILYVPGGDLIVRRDRFFELSGFDEQIETSEDCDFCQRAAASGTPAVGIAALSVEHLGTPQTLSEFFRKQRWHGSHVFQVFLKDERHIRNARSVLLAFYTLSSLAALPAGCLAAMISGHPVIALFAVAVPAILPCMLAARAAIVRGWPAIVAPLALLYLIYGTARALCLIDRRKICAIKARDVSSVTSPSAYSTSRSSE